MTQKWRPFANRLNLAGNSPRQSAQRLARRDSRLSVLSARLVGIFHNKTRGGRLHTWTKHVHLANVNRKALRQAQIDAASAAERTRPQIQNLTSFLSQPCRKPFFASMSAYFFHPHRARRVHFAWKQEPRLFGVHLMHQRALCS